MMEVVSNISDIRMNTKTLDKYLAKRVDPEYSFAIELIKRGTCFLVIKNEEGYKFFPSRFIGYKGNTIEKHQNNIEKDGRETNISIVNILGSKPSVNEVFNQEYIKYCINLGIEPREKGSYGVERKFWNCDLLN